MTVTTQSRRTPLAARRVGYVAVSAFTAWALLAINIWPGWEVLPFLTADTDRVLALFNLSLVVGLLVNIAYIVSDSAWVRSLGELITATVGLAAFARIWEVFPFDFRGDSFDWALLVRTVLVVAIVATVIGMLVNLVGYWCFGLPVSYLLGFRLGMGPAGLWYGLVLGLAVVATILLSRVRSALARERRRVLLDHPPLRPRLDTCALDP